MICVVINGEYRTGKWSGLPVGAGICCRGFSSAMENWTFRSQLEKQCAPLCHQLAGAHWPRATTSQKPLDQSRPDGAPANLQTAPLSAAPAFNSARSLESGLPGVKKLFSFNYFYLIFDGRARVSRVCQSINEAGYTVCLFKLLVIFSNKSLRTLSLQLMFWPRRQRRKFKSFFYCHFSFIHHLTCFACKCCHT